MASLGDLRVELQLISEPRSNRLLDADQLAKLAHSLGLGWFREEEVIGLWSIGLLRADLVSSTTPLERPFLRPVKERTGEEPYIYSDERTLEHRSEGYGSSMGERNTSVTLRFHPYRVYVLHHVTRTLKIETSNTQYLLYEDGVHRVTERQLEAVRHWSSSVEFGQRFEYWNSVCETAVVADPLTVELVHHDASALRALPELGAYGERARQFFVELEKSKVRQMREDLAFAAETLDDNRSVHVLLRLMSSRERSKLKGQLGCAMHLLAMAESIRRAAEDACGAPLPEEDEIGPGQWFPGARKMLYGSDRVFDATRRELRDYMTLLGLDFGVKVRCYTEGATERGALDHAVGHLGHVQLIDLKGQFAERGGKGLSFSDSLGADKHAGLFSVVVLDGDRSEYIRLIQRAAEEERFTGSFFISFPDFEFGNFSARELIEIAVSRSHLHATTPEVATVREAELLARVAEVKTNRQLFSLLAEHGMSDVRKDEQWGRALMMRAIEQPLFCGEDPRVGTKRPLVETVEVILRIRNVAFGRSLARERINPATGRAVARKEGDTP